MRPGKRDGSFTAFLTFPHIGERGFDGLVNLGLHFVPLSGRKIERHVHGVAHITWG